jgi:hypothetical protein
MDESQVSAQIEDFKTDENELEQVLEDYDLDQELEELFNALDRQFQQLEVKYQALLNTRRFLHGTQP